MSEVVIRKRLIQVEDIFHEGGTPAKQPLRRGAVLCVIRNPFAGRYVEDIAGFMDDLTPLGVTMAGSLVKALGGDAKAIQGYGKGAIIGAAGELEHGALWHVPGGYAMREILGSPPPELRRRTTPRSTSPGGCDPTADRPGSPPARTR